MTEVFIYRESFEIKQAILELALNFFIISNFSKFFLAMWVEGSDSIENALYANWLSCWL